MDITVVLPVVLYGCETWSLVLKDERRLRMIENRVLRKIFGPLRYKSNRKRRKLGVRMVCTAHRIFFG
jgi:hypothetical protein